jgi:hypothetical protein
MAKLSDTSPDSEPVLTHVYRRQTLARKWLPLTSELPI